MAEPQKVSAIMLRSPAGRILMLRRVDGEGWAFPAGGVKDGESFETAATRELWEETGFRNPVNAKQIHMRQTANGVDCTTFLADVDSEFTPRLNHEHDAWGWFDPRGVVDQGTKGRMRQPG
jgi:8-oxo-dGTP pyrophosphatase MutT (NUDIX family)